MLVVVRTSHAFAGNLVPKHWAASPVVKHSAGSAAVESSLGDAVALLIPLLLDTP
jgi:hypothetical protein